MLYDLAENKLVVDWLQGWNGFRVGLVLGAIIVAVWLPLVFTAPQVGKGDLYDLSMTVQIPVLGIVVTGIIWGLLFRHTGGVTWAIGIGLVLAIAAGLCAGLSTALGWGLDWGFGVKSFYFRIDVKPLGAAAGTLSGSIFGFSIGAGAVLGSLAAMTASSLFLRRYFKGWTSRLAPHIVSRFPTSVRQVIDPTYRYGVAR